MNIYSHIHLLTLSIVSLTCLIPLYLCSCSFCSCSSKAVKVFFNQIDKLLIFQVKMCTMLHFWGVIACVLDKPQTENWFSKHLE